MNYELKVTFLNTYCEGSIIFNRYISFVQNLVVVYLQARI